MKNLILILLLTVLTITASFGQQKVKIIAAPGIDALVARHISYNENVKGFPGYRIQIFFDAGNYSKSKAFGEKSKFLAKHPEISAYVVFQEPYYKVRVGNFRNKLEAEAFRQRIIETWPESYILKDDIEMPGIFAPEKIK